MSRNQDKKDIFENPYMQEYIRYCNSLIRQSVTAITVAGNLISGELGAKFKSANPGVIETMTHSCNELMRAAAISELLGPAMDEPIYVSSDVIVGEFAVGCRDSAPGLEVEVTGKCGLYVRTNEKALRYFLLVFIRGYAEACGAPKHLEIGASADENGSVHLRLKMAAGDGAFKFDKGIFGMNWDEVNSCIMPKLCAQCVKGDDCVEIIFDDTRRSADLSLQCRSYYPGDGSYNPFTVMLTDIF